MIHPYLSVIIPAYNEGKRLPLTLIDVDRHLQEHDFSYEIIVVISPSSDNTNEIMRRFPSIIKNLKCITLIENQGRGLAVKTGMLAAKGAWRIVMDADNSTSIVEFNKMQPYFSAKDGSASDENNNTGTHAFDIVIASRYLVGSTASGHLPIHRRLISGLGRFITRMILVRKVADPNCGFKCFSAASAEKIFGLMQTTGWLSDLEALTRALKLGYKIKEVPVHYSYEAGTHRSPRSFAQISSDYCKIWWWKLTG